MATERTLLIEHNRCLKCCCFYTTHKSADCPDGFPDKTSYSALTETEALAAKKRHMKKERAPAAVVMPVVNAVPTAVVMPSGVLGDGLDSEYVLAPFSVPHFLFNCVVGGSSASS